MSKKSDYVGKRQMKAVTVHGKHHSTTVTGNAWGVFPETLDLPVKGTKRKLKPKTTSHMLENMTISIDLNVKNLPHSEGFTKMLTDNLGIVRVKKNFEVLSTTEKIIRAFSKAKFKNVAAIELDNNVLYSHPEKFFDANNAIKTMMRAIHDKKHKGKIILLKMLSKEHKDCKVEVKVSRVHLPWVHDILITIEGELPEEYFRRVINYLEGHLKIENIVDEWKKG